MVICNQIFKINLSKTFVKTFLFKNWTKLSQPHALLKLLASKVKFLKDFELKMSRNKKANRNTLFCKTEDIRKAINFVREEP